MNDRSGLPDSPAEPKAPGPGSVYAQTISRFFAANGAVIVWCAVALIVVLIVNMLVAVAVSTTIASSAASAIAASVAADKGTKPASALAPTKEMAADLQAFDKAPSEATWNALYADISSGIPVPVESKIVEILSTRDLPQPLTDAVTIQLSSSDFAGAMQFFHKINVASQGDSSADGAQKVRRSSRLMWSLLALRSSYDSSGIDIARSDLRSGGDFVGQGMNLSNVDLAGTKLTGGTWHGSDLNNASFLNTTLTGPLTCANCAWGYLHVKGTLKLTDGNWTTP